VIKTPVINVARKREHHPFESPHDCLAFCQLVLKRPTPNAAVFARSVLFMCRHGLRPEEFANRRFGVDDETQHLRIRGTKNANAERVVPYIVEFGDDAPPRIDTLNATFVRMGSKVRCRDFRRTFAIWSQEAGIPHNRIQAYMGHGAQNVTQTYQQAVPKARTLDQDKKTLEKWFDAALARAPIGREAGPVTSSFRALMQLRRPSLGKRSEQIRTERAAAKKRYRAHPSDRP
jgi:integrase